MYVKHFIRYYNRLKWLKALRKWNLNWPWAVGFLLWPGELREHHSWLENFPDLK